MEEYENEFKPNGWGEASIFLPGKINKKYPNLARVLSETTFFRPYATEGSKIFERNEDINENLITLHLWESYTIKFLQKIKDFNWIKDNTNTTRNYFGPITLKKMTIKIIDEYGNVIDLNDDKISLTFEVTKIYQF